MTVSYFNSETSQDYLINKYFTRKLSPQSTLITTEHGAWTLLDNKEYDLLRLDNISKDPNLFTELEQKGIILTERNIELVTNLFRRRKYYVFNGSNLHIIALTSNCNHRCNYCYASCNNMTGKNMDEDTAKQVVDFIYNSPSQAVTFELSGGEPLLNFDVLRFLVDYSIERNKRFKKNIRHTMVTNLAAMDEDMLRYIIKNNIGISTSLDGPKEIHDKNRKFSGGSSYERVTYWIDHIKNEHKYKIGALPVITKTSLGHGHEIIDEYIKHDLGSIRLKNVAPVGHAKLWEKIGYSAEEYLDFWKSSLDYIIKLNHEGKKITEGLTTLILKKILRPFDANYVDLRMPCGASVGQTVYDETGKIYTCDEARGNEIFCLGDVRENTYKETAECKTTQTMQDISSGYSLLCDNCPWMPYCGVCLVCTYSENGTVIPKLPSDFKCRIHKEMFDHIFKKLLLTKDGKTFIKWENEQLY